MKQVAASSRPIFGSLEFHRVLSHLDLSMLSAGQVLMLTKVNDPIAFELAESVSAFCVKELPVEVGSAINLNDGKVVVIVGRSLPITACRLPNSIEVECYKKLSRL